MAIRVRLGGRFNTRRIGRGRRRSMAPPASIAVIAAMALAYRGASPECGPGRWCFPLAWMWSWHASRGLGRFAEAVRYAAG